jgi:hypothetical protein
MEMIAARSLASKAVRGSKVIASARERMKIRLMLTRFSFLQVSVAQSERQSKHTNRIFCGLPDIHAEFE